MKLNKTLLFNILLSLLVAASLFYLSHKGALKHLELTGLDISFSLRGNIRSNPHIVIIEITDDDITKIGRWPWKRHWEAAMAQALKDLGAKSTYFDIIFSESSDEQDDAIFEEAIKENNNVYLPFAFQANSVSTKTAFFPLERFNSHIKGTGAINIYADSDGTVRRVPLIFMTDKGPYPHMALKLALDYNGLKIKEITPKYIIASGSQGEIKIPLIENNTLLINWLNRWEKTFKHYSFLQVLSKYKDYLDKKIAPSELADFKDSVCLVAITAIGLYDIKPIPIQPEYPGIGVLATTINNIIDKKFIYTPPHVINIILLFLLCLIPPFLVRGEKPLKETLLVLAIGAAYFMVNFLLFRFGINLDFTMPLLGLFVTHLSVATYDFVRIAIEKQALFKISVTDGLTGLYNIRYFKMLLESEIILAKPDPNKIFSIVMSDIDHFKKFNDTYGHQVGDLVLKEVANVLRNSVRSSDIVARYGGEEMIILLRSATLKEGLSIAEKIRKNVEGCMVSDKCNMHHVTISLGVANFKPQDTLDSIIKRADDGLYRSKEAGRNRVSTTEEISA